MNVDAEIPHLEDAERRTSLDLMRSYPWFACFSIPGGPTHQLIWFKTGEDRDAFSSLMFRLADWRVHSSSKMTWMERP